MLENIMSQQENDLQPRVIYFNLFHLFIHSKIKSLMIFNLERRQNVLLFVINIGKTVASIPKYLIQESS